MPVKLMPYGAANETRDDMSTERYKQKQQPEAASLSLSLGGWVWAYGEILISKNPSLKF